jgi:hypothetical protein
MGTITLQFVQGSGLGAGAIKWFGHGKYSHVDCVLPVEGGLLGARNDRVGGRPAGVWIRPTGYLKKEKFERVEIPCTAGEERDFYDFVRSQIGCDYNQLGIVAFVFAKDWTTQGQWFCSQLATAGLKAAGLLKGLSELPNKIDPDDLRLIVSAVWGV